MSDLEKVVVELNRGRVFTLRLREMINKHIDEDAHMCGAGDLVEKIMSSFCSTLSILSSSESTDEDSLSSSCKNSSVKDRRGRYKRR